ncbi:DUF4231 domain-containing protein [Mycoplasma seminis]|uniref:DUF4231 domain-containing protein n=1 Tax=Mycoplasma seminis TaxID=512749 RepID=A0ABY9HB13_9MOLU|nr:DUF4231 domain-containing protein [Mycoplasma seminis]WLP85793.1 DUF4231 domain-containing protein [Mycoplasma seminis]
MKRAKKITALSAYHRLVKTTKAKLGIYGTVYYLLNLIIILATLFNGLIAVWYLAGASKFYPEGVNNPFHTWLNNNSNLNYVIATTIINALITFISGILSFFVINKKYAFYLAKLNLIKFEMELYKLKIIFYENLDQKQAEFILYKRTLAILEIDRFKSSDLSGGYLHG